METEGSLNQSIDSAAKHYSSMFFLPSFRKAIVSVLVLCLVIGLSTLAVHASQGLMGGLVLGLSFFGLTLLADLTTSKVVLKADPIFSLRRTLVLSLFGLGLWFAFASIGAFLSFPFGYLIFVKLCLLGYATIITLRIIVFIATSTSASWRKGVSVLLQPTFCLAAFVIFWAAASSPFPFPGILPFLVFAPIISLAAVLLFFYSLERLSQKTYSMSSIRLFQVFIANWVTDQNAPLEKYLEEMGQTESIEVSLLKFDASKPKAAIIVPQVHPGPFKNIGSSLLPSLLKQKFEKEYGSATCTPLGILGHECDLASQEQNHKIISQIIKSAKYKTTDVLATPFIRVTEGAATASGQVFGETIFLSFTLAPKTTEDLPQELGQYVSKEAAKYGLKNVVVVNTHNSLTNIVDTQKHLSALQSAASKCLQKAAESPTKQFLVGGASIFPKEFSLKDGMGTGGITAIVVQVDNQKTAYVVIDGNNMVPGLREEILSALVSVGFNESEVFTTDTHAVTALVTRKRGYHPVGEVMNQELLTRYICDVAKMAEANLEVSSAGFNHFTVPQVRVIGEEKLKSITLLVDKAINRAKRTLVPIFGLEGLLLILLLLLF